MSRASEPTCGPTGDTRASSATERRRKALSARGIAVFDREPARYDAWFESPDGEALFASETRCVRAVSRDLPRPWLEVGVGTGRFAEALGIGTGVDPAPGALRYAARRGIQTLVAAGDALPFEAGRFGAVFVIVTLCFAAGPVRLLREARRVLRGDGGVVLGIVPAEGPWGQDYRQKARAGHAFYSEAKFFRSAQLERLARAAGLRIERTASTLFQRPGHGPYQIESPKQGMHGDSGFVAMLCRPRLPAIADARGRKGRA